MAGSAPRSRLILLVGAPEAQSLSWSESDLTISVLPAFAENQFQPIQNSLSSDLSSSVYRAPAWRCLSLEPYRLRTGETQPTPQMELLCGVATDELSFLTEDSFAKDNEQSPREFSPVSPRNHFLEHSLVLHDELVSSQILFANVSQSQSVFDDDEDDVSTASESIDYCSAATTSLRATPHVPHVPSTLLSNLPTASRLDALQPQTLTINLLAGIISVPETPRRVVPRRWRSKQQPQRSLDLLEVVVGDMSKAGFTVSLWLGLTAQDPPHPVAPIPSAEQALRDTSLSLRRGDIVLFRNLALASWGGAVYGQSLRRGLTRMDILYRTASQEHSGGGPGGSTGGVFTAEDLDGAFSQHADDANRARNEEEKSDNPPGSGMLKAVARLRDWVRAFVPPLPEVKAGGKEKLASYERDGRVERAKRKQMERMLPPDSP